MWYTNIYNKIKGIGGNVLPPLSRSRNKVATQPEAEAIKNQADFENQLPKTSEEKPLQEKLEELHTNGFFPVPPTAMKGINPSGIIEDQHPGDYEEYEPLNR